MLIKMNQLISSAPSMLAEKFVENAVVNLGSDTPSSSKKVTKMVQKKRSKKILQYDQVKMGQNLGESHKKDIKVPKEKKHKGQGKKSKKTQSKK